MLPKVPKELIPIRYNRRLSEDFILSKYNMLLFSDSQSIRSINLSSDGSLLFTVSSNEILVWSTESKTLTRKLSVQPNTNCLASVNPTFLLSCSQDITVWDLSNFSIVTKIEGFQIPISCLAANTNWIAAGCEKHDTVVWDFKTKEKVQQITCGYARSVLLFKTSQNLILGGYNGTVNIWSLDEQKVLKTFTAFNVEVSEMALSSDENLILAVSQNDYGIVVITLNTDGKRRLEIFNKLPYSWVNISRDNKDIYYTTYDYEVVKVNINDKYDGGPLNEHSDIVSGFCVSQNEKLVYSGSHDKLVKVYDVKSDRSTTFYSHTNEITGLKIVNQNLMITCGKDKIVKVWDLRKKKIIAELKTEEVPLCLGAAFRSADIYIFCENKTFVTWNYDEDSIPKVLKGIKIDAKITGLGLLKSGRYIMFNLNEKLAVYKMKILT